MLSSNAIFQRIEAIAKTSSKNEKIAMIKDNSGHPEFVRVLEYTYNPFKTYGIVPVQPSTGIRDDVNFDDSVWDFLDNLISRKLTGNAARDMFYAVSDRLNYESAQLLWRIIIKDMKADFSESSCNKAIPKLIPDFPYMRCALPKDTDLTKWPWLRGVFVQEKADGMFANIDHEAGGVVRITSRQGSPFPVDKFSRIVENVKANLVEGNQHHGEIVVFRAGVLCERQDGNGVLNSVLSGGDFAENETPQYLVWDQIPLTSVASKGKYTAPYSLRVGGLKEQLENSVGDVKLIQTYTASSLKEAMGYYSKYLAKGKEGVVIKHPDAIWKDATSKDQIKLKLEVDVDLIIKAIVPGKDTGKNAGRPGSFTCLTEDGQLQVDVTVKNDAIREAVETNPSDWLDRIIAVKANAIMFPSESNAVHSLFLPRMAETWYRLDKDTPDSLERVKAQFDSAMNPT